MGGSCCPTNTENQQIESPKLNDRGNKPEKANKKHQFKKQKQGRIPSDEAKMTQMQSSFHYEGALTFGEPNAMLQETRVRHLEEKRNSGSSHPKDFELSFGDMDYQELSGNDTSTNQVGSIELFYDEDGEERETMTLNTSNPRNDWLQ